MLCLEFRLQTEREVIHTINEQYFDGIKRNIKQRIRETEME